MLAITMWVSIGFFGLARLTELVIVFAAKFWVSWNKNFVCEAEYDVQIDDDKLRESLTSNKMTYWIIALIYALQFILRTYLL